MNLEHGRDLGRSSPNDGGSPAKAVYGTLWAQEDIGKE
jgi:hypothetical protein